MKTPKTRSFVRSIALVTLFACHSAQAATQYASGSLTWDNTSTAAWSASPGGTYSSQWTSGNDAVFEGTAGTVTLASPTARNLTFNTTGYTLSGASTLTLSGTTPTISLGSGITATISSVIGGGAGMTKTGVGTLTLNGANGYTGTTSVKKGTLVLDGTDGAIADPLAIYSGGTLTLNNTASYKTNRLGDGKAFASNGGIFNYNVNTSSGSFVESIGTLTLNAGALTTNTTQATSGQTSTLALASITRNAGGTALFSGTGLGTNAQNNITFTTPPTLASGIIPWALMYDGTTYDLASVSGSVLAKSTYTATGESTWTANTLNARPTGSQTLAGDRLLNSLVLDAGVNLSNPSAARKLTLGNGTTPGVIVQTGGSSTIGGSVRVQPNFATSEAIFSIIGTLTINCQATNPGMVGTGGTTKTGPGTLVLGSDSSFTFTQGGMTGALNLNEGLYEVFGSTNNALAFTDTGVTFNGGNLKLNANGSNITFNKFSPILTPITVNSDGMITLDNRVSATAKAGVANTFGALTVNNSPNFTIAAGTQITSGIQQLIVGATTLNSDAIFTLNNSAAATMQLSVAAITDNSNTITLKGNGNLVQTGVWAGTGGLALDSTYTGTATLSQTNTFTGLTSINGGTLKLNTATSLAAGSSVSIATSGAVLNLNFSGTNKVSKLFIGGIQMADGIYKASGNTGTGIETTQITGTGTLTVGVAYTVTYNGNANNGGSVPTDSGAYPNSATVSVLTNSGSLTKTGYVFSGWNTQADGLGTDRAAGSTFAMGTANLTLYAKWVAATYTVTYNGNGSDGGSVPTDSGAYLNTASVSVLTNSGLLTKTGFVFSGWNTLANGLGTDRAVSSTFAMGTANVTLYAKWVAATYTVTYNGNGSDGGSVPTDSGAYLNTASVSVLTNSGLLTKTGFVFSGWNTLANGLGTDRAVSSTFAMGTANVTLYAKWVAATYTVTYNGNGSDGGSVPTDSGSYLNEATVSVLTNSGSLTKVGYVFSGWNTLANGLGTDRAVSSTFAMGTANVTLYAKWVAATYTVTYNGNGSDGGSVPTDSGSYLNEATVSVLTNSGSLTKVGYVFSGWNTQADGQGADRAASSTFAMGIANVTLYAKWVAATYTVTYSGNGSDGGSVPTDSGSYLNEATVSVLTNSGSLTKVGYVFSGWNTQADGLGNDRAASSTFEMGTANVTLYAKWEAATYTVTYSGNGSDGGSVPTDSGSYLNEATVSVLTNSGSLTKVGYVFSGWNTQADGLGNDRAASSTFEMSTANVTLYAKWIINNNFSSWAATHAGGGAVNGDFDNDGVSNGVEYFMNITTPGFTANPTLNGSNTVTWTNGGNIPSSAYGTQFVVQISTDLSVWNDVPDTGDSNLTNISGSVSYTLTGTTPLFVRLVVTPD